MRAMVVKEFRELRRDRRTVAMIVALPVLLLVGGAQLGELEHRDELFDDFCLTPFHPAELEARLLELFLDELSTLASERITALRAQWGEAPETITVVSAYPLTDDKRQRLEQALNEVTGLNIPIDYQQNPELVAGLCITIGNWVLHINVRDDLKGFAEFAHATR